MSDFQFRTRGQQSPQGKQRVYFTCHPDDFEKYFEEIQKEILDRQDCAVFYLEPGTQLEDVEDYELRLREMQLFVVPVTTKLLTKENRAMDVDVPFAFENHIPVLPLMQESGLDDVFNKKFGDLQYLYKNDTDPTAIPYEEKLTKYLESVIVGDELAKKVRAAFDAYIFLSYRKKDRKYAQELMKLIHSNPLCRDIAIWYDEFLTPGENFNEAIRAALEKSELFALAVTPNLINEINYILTTEYPMAQDMGKKILPVEMLETSPWRFKRKYKKCPKPINRQDAKVLQDKLIKLLGSIAVRENDTDPQHNFFIGLAYLGGIDVEVDHERAVALITGAAEQGYIPAIEKLVSMYNNGEGVKRDVKQALQWQEKLVDILSKENDREPSVEHALAYARSAVDMFEICEDLGIESSLIHFNLLTQIYEEALRFKKQYSDYEFDIIAFKCCVFIGNIVAIAEKYDIADEWYDRAHRFLLLFMGGGIVNILKESGQEIRSTMDSFMMNADRHSITILLKEAELSRKLGETEKALKKLSTALSKAEKLVESSGENADKRLLSLCYYRKGAFLGSLGRTEEKEKLMRMAWEIDCRLATETRQMDHITDAVFDLYSLAMLDMEKKNITGASEKLQRAYEMLNNYVDEIVTDKPARLYAKICYRLGQCNLDSGNLPAAEGFYLSAWGKVTFIQGSDLSLECKILYGLGEVYEKQKDVEQFERYYYKLMEILRFLINEKKCTEKQEELADCIFEMAYMHLKYGIVAKANALFILASDEYRKVSHYEQSPRCLYRISFCYSHMAKQYEQTKVETAILAWKMGIRALEQLTALTDASEDWGDLADALLSVATLFDRENNEIEKAARYYTQADKAYQKALRGQPEKTLLMKQAICLDMLTRMYQRMNGDASAMESSIKCVKVFNLLYELDKNDEVIVLQFADSLLNAGMLNSNKDYLQKAISLAEESNRQAPSKLAQKIILAAQRAL